MKTKIISLIILIVCASLFAVDEIHIDYDTGRTVYAARFQPGGNVFVTNGSSDQEWAAPAASADLYDVTMTENGSGGHYVGSFDTIPNIADGTYKITVYEQLGGAPANGDPAIYVGTIKWKDGAEDRQAAESDHATTDALITSSHSTTDGKIDTTDALITSSHSTTDGKIDTTDALITSSHSTTDGKIDTTDALITSSHSTTDGKIDTTDTLITNRTLLAADYFDASTDPVEILASGGSAGKNADELVDDFWDENISRPNHNVGQSAAKILRESNISITADTAQGPGTGNNQIQLASGASDVDGAYDPAMVFIKDGTGAGQSRNILQYKGSTRTATVDRNWKMNPDDSSEYVILADAGREHVNEGLAQQGSSTVIRLNTLASSANSAYTNQFVFIRSGTGEDQVRRVISYNGSTKDATVSEAWDINPDSTSGYVMLPMACVEVQAIKNHELSPKAGINFDTFFDASGNVTTTEVSDIDSILTLATLMRDMMEGDVFTNTGSDPWQMIIRTKGTASALVTKDLYEIDGTNITAVTQRIGRKTEP